MDAAETVANRWLRRKETLRDHPCHGTIDTQKYGC